MVVITGTTNPYEPPLLDDIPDVEEDQPVDGTPLRTLGKHHLPYLIFGAGTLANQYNDDHFLNGDGPTRTVRLALRYGMCAIDTSPYYGSSEVILGAVLRSLSSVFPRTSYKLITKVGRYSGSDATGFDYSPDTIRKSVLRSLSRLGTDYLDVVYLHDVEFIATPVRSGSTAGNPLEALEDPAEWGLAKGEEARILGEGDQKILGAIRELWKLKTEGTIKAVGISGYPLQTLLRIAMLIFHNPPYTPLDILLSYSHYTLQNKTFEAFIPYFIQRANIGQLVIASPFSMGLLTPKAPSWHPAPPGMMKAKDRALEFCQDWEGGLPNVALGFTLREGENEMKGIPRVVGLSSTTEVHETMKAWRQVHNQYDEHRLAKENAVRGIFKEAGYLDYSWKSP